ncbi:hypothetical protein [Fibrella aquatica]|jgi:hypothetical protein|uniref:hypothetical protein n=1 Tax=Fibrella aquatica TaxID=3242487 RepID=UPI003520871F
MKKSFAFFLPLLALAACTQEPESSDQFAQKIQSEEAMIARGVESLRIRSFYVPDPQNPATDISSVSDENIAAFTQKSKLFQANTLLKQSSHAATEQYQAFVKANLNDPRLSQFKRETAEAMLSQGQALSVADKAYFTRELITNRSSNLAMMSESLLSLRGKIGTAEHNKLMQQTQQLMNQYDAFFNTELVRRAGLPTSTYRQRALKALEIRYAELALNMVRENRQLLQGVQ